MLNPATREFAAPGRFALTLPLPGTRAREIPTRPKILIAQRVPLDNFTSAQTLPTWVPQVSRFSTPGPEMLQLLGCARVTAQPDITKKTVEDLEKEGLT